VNEAHSKFAAINLDLLDENGRISYKEKKNVREELLFSKQENKECELLKDTASSDNKEKEILGIHHITAVASHPQPNIDFYTTVLGLRLVKLTVNYDDPGTYHLYYGNESGEPGTILTFFPWPSAPRGQVGSGQVTTISFRIPENSVDFWKLRLSEHGIVYQGPTARFTNSEKVLAFSDPDGLHLELVENEKKKKKRWDGSNREPSAWKDGPVPIDYAIRGFNSAALSENDIEPTKSMLVNLLGFRETKREGNRFRFEVSSGGAGASVDLIHLPDLPPGLVSSGTVHHIAWRTPNDEQQRKWRSEISSAGFSVTPIIDRKYFHSIYFREPGGVLFEIATDPPGFTVDESLGELGSSLKLPERLEPLRLKLEQTLPPVTLPQRPRKALLKERVGS
jgi:glyoxalase family protein